MKDADRSSKRRFHETLLLARRSRSVQFYVRNDIITIDDNDLPMLHNGHDCSNHGKDMCDGCMSGRPFQIKNVIRRDNDLQCNDDDDNIFHD